MRLRNVKNKEAIINQSEVVVKEPMEYQGSWQTLFNNTNPIYVEIGMGKGKFIIENALRHPEINFIGIERYDSVIARAIEKVPENGLDNLRFIRMNAIEIERVFHKEIDRIYLNFSDPWPKKRHALRRLTSPIFLEKYEKLFKDGKEIMQKTDNRNLFEYSLISLNANGYQITDISLDLHHSEIEENVMTEYEEKFVEQDKIIYYLHAKK